VTAARAPRRSVRGPVVQSWNEVPAFASEAEEPSGGRLTRSGRGSWKTSGPPARSTRIYRRPRRGSRGDISFDNSKAGQPWTTADENRAESREINTAEVSADDSGTSPAWWFPNKPSLHETQGDSVGGSSRTTADDVAGNVVRPAFPPIARLRRTHQPWRRAPPRSD